MPFESDLQRKWMYIHHPKMAKRWSKHTPKGKKLPKHVGESPEEDSFGHEGFEVAEFGMNKDPLGINEGATDLDWQTDKHADERYGGTWFAITPAGRYEIVKDPYSPLYWHFIPSTGASSKYNDFSADNLDSAKAAAEKHWNDLQQHRKFDEPLSMPQEPQSAAFRGGTKHGRYNRSGISGVNRLDLNSYDVNEIS